MNTNILGSGSGSGSGTRCIPIPAAKNSPTCKSAAEDRPLSEYCAGFDDADACQSDVACCQWEPQCPHGVSSDNSQKPGSINWHQKLRPTDCDTVDDPLCDNSVSPVISNDGQIVFFSVAGGADDKKYQCSSKSVQHKKVACNAVVALTTTDGNKKWTYPTENSMSDSAPILILNNDSTEIFVLSSTTVAALRTNDGKEIWIQSINIALASVESLSPDSSILFVIDNDYTVFALDTRKGKTLWSFKLYGTIMTPPSVNGNIVYVGGAEKTGSKPIQAIMYAINITDGSVKWKYEGQTNMAIEHISCNKNTTAIYALVAESTQSGQNFFIYAFDSVKGHILWNKRLPKNIITDTLILSPDNETLYFVAAYTGTYYAYDTSKGSQKWKYTYPNSTQEFVFTDPCVSADNKIMYFTSSGINGTDYITGCLDASDGSLIWDVRETNTEGGNVAPVLSSDGANLFLISRHGTASSIHTGCKYICTLLNCTVTGGGECNTNNCCVGQDKNLCGYTPSDANETRTCDKDGYYIKHKSMVSGSSTTTHVSDVVSCEDQKIPYCQFKAGNIILGCKDLCDGVHCGSYGKCVNGTCVCDPGWTGPSCTIPPPPKPSPPPPTKNKKKKLSAGAIVGIVFGCIAAILILAFLIIHHKRKN